MSLPAAARLQRSLIAGVLTISGLATACSTPSTAADGSVAPTPPVGALPTSGGPAVPAPPNVMVIVEENHSQDDIIGNPALPFLNDLARTYGQATNYVGVSHPSEPNYLAMVSGSIWNNPPDRTPQEGRYSGPTVVDQLAEHGIGWKAYLEDMPQPCDLTDSYGPGGYDVNHNPFLYFTKVRSSTAQCGRVVPFTQFASDLNAGTAPSFIFVAPNTTNDMHDGTPQQGDAWLSTQFRTIFASSWYRQGGTVVVTFDEGETAERVATVVVSERDRGVAPLTTPINHYGLLRGIEETYGLALLGSAADPASGDLKPLLTS